MSSTHNQFGTCRICSARIIWVKTRSGKNMPVNPELVDYKEVAGGRERIVTPMGTVVAGEKVSPKEADGYGYISHFATCAGR